MNYVQNNHEVWGKCPRCGYEYDRRVWGGDCPRCLGRIATNIKEGRKNGTE